MESNGTCPTEPGLADDGLSNMHIWGWLGSGVLVLVTWVVAVHTIFIHLAYYNNKGIQRHKVRVVAYPPIYATLAWVSYLKYGASTTIMFFATLIESFAVYNLYALLEAYLAPFRDSHIGMPKEAITTKVMGLKKVTVNIVSAFISIITQLHGTYCPGAFSPKGAYIWLTVINFCSLSLILAALFTHLAIYANEWKMGKIKAHGMFWCVKGPIMIIFYFGNILLSALVYFNVIKDVPAANGGTDWPAAAIKNGYYSIVVCFVMMIDALFMMKYYGMDEEDYFDHKDQHMNFFVAMADAFLAFIPQFFRNLFSCGQSTVRLAKKRQQLKLRRHHDGDDDTMALNRDFNHRDSDIYEADPMADIDLEQLPPMQPTHFEAKMFHEEGNSATRIRELGTINPYTPPVQESHNPYPAASYPAAYGSMNEKTAASQSPESIPHIPPPPQRQATPPPQPAFEFEDAYAPQIHHDALSMPPRSQFPRDRSPKPTANAEFFNPHELQAQHATQQNIFNPYAENKPNDNPFR
ncbi:hypothetical protein NQZ79_g1395 [Umbelopsis isabellina]|nr:hypothetical protein NQZ79_g1395 [Umbelopsis isabellina]